MGPKMTIFCTIVSIWGIIQLSILAVFFYLQSVALLEDVSTTPFKEVNEKSEEFYKAVDIAYTNSFWNCIVALILYLFNITFLSIRFLMQRRKNDLLRLEKERLEYETYIEQMLENYVGK